MKCAFGIMAKKLRILKRESDVLPHTGILLIKAMCLLHNTFIDIEKITDFIYSFGGEEQNARIRSRKNNRPEN